MTSTDRLFAAIRAAAPGITPLLLAPPTSEWEVVFLLGQLSSNGEFRLLKATGGFPDCTLRLDADPLEEIRVEVETDSSHYLLHKHPFTGCDAVICWTESAKLPIPTLSLSGLFPELPKAQWLAIDFAGKQPHLMTVFDHFRQYLITKGLIVVQNQAPGSTNTLKFVLPESLSPMAGPSSTLCALQFCGAGNNEYVRLRFYRKPLEKRGSQRDVASAFQAAVVPNQVAYSQKQNEERLDFYSYHRATCDSVVQSLDAIL